MNDTLTLALVQHNIIWNNIHENLERIDILLDTINQEIQLIVLPEMFATGFITYTEQIDISMQSYVLSWLQEKASKLKAVIAGSYPFYGEGIFRNRFLFIYPNGSIRYYDKRHLFSYAGEDKHYSAGKNQEVLDIFGWVVCPQVCYDLRFPVWSRNTMNYDLLLYTANWPTARKRAWNVLLPARAIENQAYVAGVNRVGTDGNGIKYDGESQIISPHGELLAMVEGASEQIIQMQLNKKELVKYRADYPFLKDGDTFQL